LDEEENLYKLEDMYLKIYTVHEVNYETA